MNRRLLSSLLLLVLAGTGLAPAQKIAVRALALKSGEFPELYLRGEKAHVPLEFSTIQPGEVIPALGANPLPLYRREMNEDGEETYVVDRKVKLPSGAKGILLLGWMKDDEPRFAPIDDDFASARFNDWLLINTGPRPIAFKVGEKSRPVEVKPGSSTRYRIGAQGGKGATVLAQAPFDGKAKTFFSTYWPVYPDRRTIILFVDDGRKIRVKRISDKVTS